MKYNIINCITSLKKSKRGLIMWTSKYGAIFDVKSFSRAMSIAIETLITLLLITALLHSKKKNERMVMSAMGKK
jgi:hypothetical protein